MKEVRKWRLENENERARVGDRHIAKERENEKAMVRERKWDSTGKQNMIAKWWKNERLNMWKYK